MKQIPSHYQAVLPSTTPAFNFEKAIGIDNLLDILTDYYEDTVDACKEMNELYQFFIPYEDEFESEEDLLLANLKIGKIKFIDDDDKLPTANSESIGAIVSLCGKEYIIFIDDNLNMCVGHNGELCCFSESDSFIDDCNELYWYLFGGIYPEQIESNFSI